MSSTRCRSRRLRTLALALTTKTLAADRLSLRRGPPLLQKQWAAMSCRRAHLRDDGD